MPRLHPKVVALGQIIRIITLEEIEKVRKDHERWLGKIVVFNKLIRGTAKQLNSHLQATVTPLFQEFLNEMVGLFGVRDVRQWRQTIRAEAFRQLRELRKSLNSEFGRHSLTPTEFRSQLFEHYNDQPLVDCFKPRLEARVRQPLFLLRCLLRGRATTTDSIRRWLRSEIFEDLERDLHAVIDLNLDDTPEEGFSKEDLFTRAENHVIRLLEEMASVDVVGRYDGDDIDGREARRRNFNDFYNPYILIVSRVGEEGIDLQRQCRYVLHYDLEWNPAKMEQREGRVDRDGFNAQLHGSIDVRFFLLKHTYEERVFHTVMQRDAWFQVLIGAKRRELGSVGSLEEEGANPDDREARSTTIETNSGTLKASERTAKAIVRQARVTEVLAEALGLNVTEQAETARRDINAPPPDSVDRVPGVPTPRREKEGPLALPGLSFQFGEPAR